MRTPLNDHNSITKIPPQVALREVLSANFSRKAALAASHALDPYFFLKNPLILSKIPLDSAFLIA